MTAQDAIVDPINRVCYRNHLIISNLTYIIRLESMTIDQMTPQRSIRSFVLRKGRITPSQSKALQEDWSEYRDRSRGWYLIQIGITYLVDRRLALWKLVLEWEMC